MISDHRGSRLSATVAVVFALAAVAAAASCGGDDAKSGDRTESAPGEAATSARSGEVPPEALPPTEPLPRGKEPPPLDPTLERALSRLEPTAHDRWPDTFAGLWITGETTDDEIYVAFTEDAERNVAALAEGFPYPRMLQAWTFERSLRELKTLQLGLLADRELAAEGELEIPGLPDGRFDLGTDVAQNKVMVTVEQLEPEPTAWFEERHGDDVVVEEGPPFVPE